MATTPSRAAALKRSTRVVATGDARGAVVIEVWLRQRGTSIPVRGNIRRSVTVHEATVSEVITWLKDRLT